MRALEIVWEIFFCSFSSLFQIFLCEASERCYGLSGWFSWMTRRFSDGDSGCPNDTVHSSGRPFFLSGRACLCNLLRGTTFRRHLSSIRMVNPVGLNRILPGVARHFLLSFCFVCLLVFFPCDFYVYFPRARVFFAFYLLPGMFVYLFTVLF
jgi:hypothetical protein